MAKQYWLMKSEPDIYSIEDLERDGITFWDGVRNYQARNFMRDRMQVGDEVLFYHSSAKPPGVAGVAKVARVGYPDPTAFDPADPHYDPQSDPANPRWFGVDVEFVQKFDRLVALEVLRDAEGLEDMVLNKRSRLSVQPVTPGQFRIVRSLAAALNQ